MAWITPNTFNAGDPLLAAELNEIRDSLNALKTPPRVAYSNGSYGVSITGVTSFAVMDATNLNWSGGSSIVTAGGRLFIMLQALVTRVTALEYTGFSVWMDGAPLGNASGGLGFNYNNLTTYGDSLTRLWLTDPLTAGAHSLTVLWAALNGTQVICQAINFAAWEV